MGKVEISRAAVFYEFVKDSSLQKMIHVLKYEENKELGISLAKQIAYEMESSLFFNSIDYIIPVPLHPKKEKVRGYNQSLCIANGIKEILKIKIDSNIVCKEKLTPNLKSKRINIVDGKM
ncbi:MAG: ComF family protein [Flavobacteriales bacterium]